MGTILLIAAALSTLCIASFLASSMQARAEKAKALYEELLKEAESQAEDIKYIEDFCSNGSDPPAGTNIQELESKLASLQEKLDTMCFLLKYGRVQNKPKRDISQRRKK